MCTYGYVGIYVPCIYVVYLHIPCSVACFVLYHKAIMLLAAHQCRAYHLRHVEAEPATKSGRALSDCPLSWELEISVWKPIMEAGLRGGIRLPLSGTGEGGGCRSWWQSEIYSSTYVWSFTCMKPYMQVNKGSRDSTNYAVVVCFFFFFLTANLSVDECAPLSPNWKVYVRKDAQQPKQTINESKSALSGLLIKRNIYLPRCLPHWPLRHLGWAMRERSHKLPGVCGRRAAGSATEQHNVVGVLWWPDARYVCVLLHKLNSYDTMTWYTHHICLFINHQS